MIRYIFREMRQRKAGGATIILLLLALSGLQAQTDSSGLISSGKDSSIDKQHVMTPLIGCSISGSTSVTGGTSTTYNLICDQTATSWTITCGTITYSDNVSATVFWNGSGCSSAVLTAKNGSNLATKSITITYPALVPGSVTPGSLTINYNTSPGALSITGVSGGNGVYSYQWQSSVNTSSWSNISGATASSYTPPAITAKTYYRANVPSNGSTYPANYATVNVYPQIIGGDISPASATINYNTAPGTLTLSGVSGGNGAYSYQWQSSPDGSNWTNISGGTGGG